MAWRQAHAAEVVGRLHDALPEVPEPNAVDDAAPGERVVGAGDPLGERGAPVAFRVLGGQIEFKILLLKNRQCAGTHVFAWLEDVAAMQHLDGARLAAGGLEIALRFKLRSGGVHHLPGRDFF